MVRLLVGAGADVNAPGDNGETPLHRAVRERNPAVAALLLENAPGRLESYGAGSTPLHVAAGWTRDPAVIVLLVGAGADVSARNRSGYSPLHYAARDNSEPAVTAALVAAGAEVNARGASDEVWSDRESMAATTISRGGTPWGERVEFSDNAGIRSPLHEAVMEHGDSAVVAALIESGADVNAKADLDRMFEPAATPLYWAVSANPHPAVPGLLVQAGADVNARCGSEWTPLHLAALRNPILFPKLLELGADPEALDRYGKTPMDYAAENLWLQGWEVVRRLRETRENEPG